MKFRFKADAWTVSVLLAAVLSVVALVFSVISNSKGLAASETDIYAVSGLGAVIACCAAAIVLAVAAFLFDCLFEGRLFSIIVDVMKIAAAGLLIACICIMIDTRGDLMGYIWFSDLEAGNANAVSALYMALVSWIAYFLAVVSIAVSVYGTACAGGKASGKETEMTDETAA